MGTVSHQVKKVGELLEQRLAIPSYQGNPPDKKGVTLKM